MKTFLGKLKGINIVDIGHVFLFLCAILPAHILKRKRKNMWLVCEYEQEARDNGYWFYKYVREQHPEQDIVYAISFHAKDYMKVCNLGECIQYGTLKHWIYYLCASVNISSHKGGKPNAAVCYFLEVYNILQNKRVFLQHGITQSEAETFFYKNTKMRLFICGAAPEYKFVCEKFGYPQENVAYTGFARFDTLLQTKMPDRKMILVAPTWRQWLYKVSSNPYENKVQDIESSQYYQTWVGLLQSERLVSILEKYHYEIVFFPHRNLTNSFQNISKISKNIRCITWENADLQKLLMQAACMITDYSSTAMDFAYMNKPLIYYQFDEEEYKERHLKPGYFDSRRDGFGRVCARQNEVLEELETILKADCKVSLKYQKRIDKFFLLRDTCNCQRIFDEIARL